MEVILKKVVMFNIVNPPLSWIIEEVIWIEFDIGTAPACSLNILSSLVKIKLHTKNQTASLLNSGDSCEEDINPILYGVLIPARLLSPITNLIA